MLNDNYKKLIIIPFNIPWDWPTDYTNQTALELSKQGHFVICNLIFEGLSLKEMFVKNDFYFPLKFVSKNVLIFRPIYIIPFRSNRFIEKLNIDIANYFLRLLAEIIYLFHKMDKKVIWIFDPNLYFLYKYFNNFLLLYDCIDYFAVGTKKNIKITTRNERAICRKAYLVVANSNVLKKYLEKYRLDVKLVPQGFRLNSFKNLNFKKIPSELIIKKKNRPLIGFVGGVNYRIDFKLIYLLAKKQQGWDFVLWGPILDKDKFKSYQMAYYQKLLKLKNVIFGESNKENIPFIISQFNLGIIPYAVSDNFTKYCYPMKLFEYFYMEKPVVSSDIVELQCFTDYIKIAKNLFEWQKFIKTILKNKTVPHYFKKGKRLAEKNSWQNKIKAIFNYI